MLAKSDNFETLLDSKLGELDIWIKKIEKSNRPFYIPPELYANIKKYVEEAFLHDFNMVIEEFPFYYDIAPKMQDELIKILFGDFQNNFKSFFNYCERGFANEVIVNMYCRIYEPDETIVSYGQKFNEVFFIREGAVRLFNKFQFRDFIVLPRYSVFGDYQILYDLKSNIIFKSCHLFKFKTKLMCVSKKVFLNLCELFPVTAENLKTVALERR